jgi:hypothetical protein
MLSLIKENIIQRFQQRWQLTTNCQTCDKCEASASVRMWPITYSNVLPHYWRGNSSITRIYPYLLLPKNKIRLATTSDCIGWQYHIYQMELMFCEFSCGPPSEFCRSDFCCQQEEEYYIGYELTIHKWNSVFLSIIVIFRQLKMVHKTEMWSKNLAEPRDNSHGRMEHKPLIACSKVYWLYDPGSQVNCSSKPRRAKACWIRIEQLLSDFFTISETDNGMQDLRRTSLLWNYLQTTGTILSTQLYSINVN